MNTHLQAQKQLTDFIRDPDQVAGPEGIEPRRLAIYRDLFFNNINSFLCSGFPVTRSLYVEDSWREMVRDFMRVHRCQTPLFLEISQEFLSYLGEERDNPADPPFLLELAHYEWVELALDVAEVTAEEMRADREGDLLDGRPVVSPLSWSLGYQYPVHRIGVEYQPQEPPGEPTYLVVYRNSDYQVKFMEINATTARLLAILGADASLSGRQAIEQLGVEMGHPDREALTAHGLKLLEQLRELEIILGSDAGTGF